MDFPTPKLTLFQRNDYWNESQPLLDHEDCAYTGRCHQTLGGEQVFVHMLTKGTQVQVFVHVLTKGTQVPGPELGARNSGCPRPIPVLTKVSAQQQETRNTGCSRLGLPPSHLSLQVSGPALHRDLGKAKDSPIQLQGPLSG